MGERSEAQKKADKAYYEKVKGQKKIIRSHAVSRGNRPYPGSFRRARDR